MQFYLIQIIATIALIILLPVGKYIIRKLIRKYASIHKKFKERTDQVVRIFMIISNLMFFVMIFVIWGVDPHNLLVTLSSVFAVIGVAMFAQWSILSNITAGIIIFFTTPFRIGDYIRLMDKELPVDAHVEDIFTFHTLLKTKDGEIISYPNSLFFQKGVMLIHIESWEDEDIE